MTIKQALEKCDTLVGVVASLRVVVAPNENRIVEQTVTRAQNVLAVLGSLNINDVYVSAAKDGGISIKMFKSTDKGIDEYEYLVRNDGRIEYIIESSDGQYKHNVGYWR